MVFFLPFFVLIPLLGFVLSFLVPPQQETLLSRVAFLSVGAQFVGFVAFFAFWLLHGRPLLDVRDVVLYKNPDYEFFIDFYFDKITAVYLFVGAFLTFLVTIYSRAYLHREPGYKRFFNTILFFYVGYNVAIMAGNFETLFIGWEMLGIASFLLIAFYRDRYLPVKNALKVFSVYRIGDIGLLLAMWASHHLWHENITFMRLHNSQMVHEHLLDHSLIGIFISLAILVTAAAKSAQLPFSSWLPRAMEGPTPSSAIFYGSLSVHLGVFLLLRTEPFWAEQTSIRILIGLVGLATALVATIIARVQSSIKSQIAYSSVAQIGLIFIEVAFGLDNFALLHFAGNAFLRTYQLLVSPSAVSYLIKEQFYNFVPREDNFKDTFSKRVRYSFYILAIKEFNLDRILSRLLWEPLKNVGRSLKFLTLQRLVLLFVPAYLLGLFFLSIEEVIPPTLHRFLPALFACIGLVLVLKSYAEKEDLILSWLCIVMNHFWIVLAISFNAKFDNFQSFLYLSGVVASGLLGYLCLRQMQKREGKLDLNQFYGHAYEHPKNAFLFLLACLGVSGFPITPTFIGEDLIFSHIYKTHFLLAFLVSLTFVVDGIALLRIYARIYLGQHIKTYHQTPYKSS